MKNYQSIIIFLNRRCAVGCASCNVAARADSKDELSPQWLSAFFNKLEGLELSGYFIWTGGEPFLSFDSLLTGISLAEARGFHSEILTGGMWFMAQPGWLERLAAYRNLSIRVSLDEEHQEKVPFPLVIDLVRRAWVLGIEVNFTLREVPGAPVPVQSYLDDIEKQLPEYYRANSKRSRWIHYIPHIPIRASVPADARDAPDNKVNKKANNKAPAQTRRQKYKRPCPMAFRDLVIGPDGMVYPCCGFFRLPFHPRLAVGDPLNESWLSLADRRFSRPLFRTLLEKGPYGICQQMKLAPETWGWPFFSIPCHVCMALFSEVGEKVLDSYP